MLEKRYGRTLAKVEDLEPECRPSLTSLTELITGAGRWAPGRPKREPMMAVFISEKDVSTAWVAGLSTLVASGGDAINLAVAIAAPTAEQEGVRQLLDQFIGERRRINTIQGNACRRGQHAVPVGLVPPRTPRRGRRGESIRAGAEHPSRDPPADRAVPTSSGWWHGLAPRKEEFNQLDQAVRRLRSARERGHQRGHEYEVGLAMPADEIAAPVLVAGKDRNTRGFPCLSHLSLVCCTAWCTCCCIPQPRLHQQGVRQRPGSRTRPAFRCAGERLPAGELTCVSASATAEMTRGAFGMSRVERLLEDCQAALGATP